MGKETSATILDKQSFFAAMLQMLGSVHDMIPNVKAPVECNIAGGTAVAFWIDLPRVSRDLDVFYSHRLLPPSGLSALFEDADGKKILLEYDYGFSETMSLLHHDFASRRHMLSQKFENMHVFVLAPVDIAIMKLTRFDSRDQQDIQKMVDAGVMHNAKEFSSLAEDAQKDYIGDLKRLEWPKEQVAKWIVAHQKNISRPVSCFGPK